MLVSEFNDWVRKTDQFEGYDKQSRREIALYGLVGEIGSLVSAVKKQMLGEGGAKNWNIPNDEISEELGDVIWYCFSLAQISYPGDTRNIFIRDIALLKKEIGADDERALKIRAALDDSKRAAFLEAASAFPNTPKMRFSDYQKLAFLTARTDGRVLLQVCIAVLWQLGAELLRKTLPDIELDLNTKMDHRNTDVVIGEIAWHISAIASLYGLSLDDIAEENVKKTEFRSIRAEPTPLHDEKYDNFEQLPRRMEITFVSSGPEEVRMYFEGKQLGDELTDNSHSDDGYRFHDVMHLANAAFLGWSPVLRSLLKRKRKSNKVIDRVEDGARAKIVEELVLKAIHSEGTRLAQREPSGSNSATTKRLFPTRSHITFKLIKTLQSYVEGLEVRANKAWEWEDAIFNGAETFQKLREHGQGTVTIDMSDRTLTFSPNVSIGLKGLVAGVGTKHVTKVQSGADEARRVLIAETVLLSLGVEYPTDEWKAGVQIEIVADKQPFVRCTGQVRELMWKRKVIDFEVTISADGEHEICTAIALSDPKD
jgi:NTP pyrophosphatase (non-canonical NTP hydrolase)